MKTTTLVALDIGTTKVCTVAGRLNEFGKLEILGFNTTPSNGVLRGIVSNIDKTVSAITSSTQMVSKLAGINVNSVLASISGQHIKSFSQHNTMTREDQLSEISEKDIQQLQRPKGIEIHWITETSMADEVLTLTWLEGEVMVWCACEFNVMRELRQYFRNDKEVQRDNLYISSYWKQGASEDSHKAIKRKYEEMQE